MNDRFFDWSFKEIQDVVGKLNKLMEEKEREKELSPYEKELNKFNELYDDGIDLETCIRFYNEDMECLNEKDTDDWD